MTTLCADPLAPFRGRLLGLAYRMLGSRTDAEDVLQDTYLRIHGATGINNLEAFLVTMVTRLCLDRLRGARVRRETYVGPWLPEPVVDAAALSPDTAAELADDLSFALLLTLERLAPSERAAFLLHDIFEVGFIEIAVILEKTEAACRQLASRARKTVRAGRPMGMAAPGKQAALLAAFGAALESGDLTSLTALLREDAILLSDGGGIKRAALNPIHGAGNIARYMFGVLRKSDRRAEKSRAAPRLINGALGVLVYLEGKPEQTVSLLVDGDQIAAIYVVRNPEKLAHLTRDDGEDG